jgi:LPXTG-motif cell wall-anchored protein
MISTGESNNFVADTTKKVTGNAASQAIVVNKVPTAQVKLHKVGDGDTANSLAGVQFKIFYDEACTKPVTKDAAGVAIPGMDANGIITTDENGSCALGTLSGTYYFKEVATTGGYNLLSAPVQVKIEKDGENVKVTASSTQDGVIFDNRPDWIKPDTDGVWVVTVNNSSGTELPMTGGLGTTWFAMGGVTLMLGAAMVIAGGRLKAAAADRKEGRGRR